MVSQSPTNKKRKQPIVIEGSPSSWRSADHESDSKEEEPEESTDEREVIIVLLKLPIRVAKNEKGEWIVTWEGVRSWRANLRVLSKTMKVKWVGMLNEQIARQDRDDVEFAL